MSWSVGANVLVAISEQDDLAAGKVLHENKSGTVRIQLNDGSKITVGPDEVFENPNKTPKSRQRSRSPARKSTGSRGRSPGRGRPPKSEKSPARAASAGRKRSTSRGRKPATTPKTKEEKPEKASTAKKIAEKKKQEEPTGTPTMTLRVRRWNKDENIDSDTDETTKPKKKNKDDSTSKPQLEWGGTIGVVLMFAVFVGVTFGALLMIRSGSFNLRGLDWRKLVAQWPKWDWNAVGLLLGFWAFELLLALLPVGPIENALPGSTGPRQYRRNGFLAAVVTVSGILGLRRYGYALTKAQLLAYLPVWAATGTIVGFILAIYFCWKGYRVPVSQQNPAVASAGKIYTFFIGKQINPVIRTFHVKMFFFKLGLTSPVVLALLIYLNFEPTGYAQLVSLALPCIYLLDALLFEQTFLTSFGIQTEGFGFFFTSMIGIYPALAMVNPLYVITAKVEMQTWCVVFHCLVFTVGLLINRLSCNQKYRFRKNPMDPAVSHLETLPTARGKKLLVSGWWGLVRHPNYFGDILMQMSFGLNAGFGHALPWFLPATTILMFFQRVGQDHRHCQAKYGDAWSRYCEKVKQRVLPKIY